MQLRNGEAVAKIVKRHRTPYFFRLFKIFAVAAPAYAVMILLIDETGASWFLILLAVISFFLGIVIAIVSLEYLLDKLVITNKRVIWIDWHSLFKREEHEAELFDIQDIQTRETGILSKLRIFDYGLVEVETASSKTCIIFIDCPDPEGTKNFILSQLEKQKGGFASRHDVPEEEGWSVN